MNKPGETSESGQLPDWKFPDLCEHLLASQVLASKIIIDMMSDFRDLQPLLPVLPVIPTLQPAFSPTTDQQAYIHRLDERVNVINAHITDIQKPGTPEGVQSEIAVKLSSLLDHIFDDQAQS